MRDMTKDGRTGCDGAVQPYTGCDAKVELGSTVVCCESILVYSNGREHVLSQFRYEGCPRDRSRTYVLPLQRLCSSEQPITRKIPRVSNEISPLTQLIGQAHALNASSNHSSSLASEG